MNWNNTQQVRFDELRKRELAGTLSALDQKELVEMVTWLEQDEARYLAPSVARAEAKQRDLLEQLRMVQNDNGRLVQQYSHMINKQERLDEESSDWQNLSLTSFTADWDNTDDAIYDNWREHYDVRLRHKWQRVDML